MATFDRRTCALALAVVAGAHCGSAEISIVKASPDAAPAADAGLLIDGSPGDGSCPTDRPNNGVSCSSARACLYLDVLCQCDPAHGWVCGDACGPQPPPTGAGCAAAYACAYGDIACQCDDGAWSCRGAGCVTTWPMPNASLVLDADGAVTPGATLPNAPSYDVTPDVTVDRTTGLMWQTRIDEGDRNWADARTYCDDLALAGYADWRLPTRIELVSIADLTRTAPAIDPAAFPGTPIGFYWTSSPRPDSNLAWSIDFESGAMYSGETTFAVKTRCVRPVRAAEDAGADPSCYVTARDTVYDALAHLTWQRAYDASAYTFADAQAHCASLALDGGGWRVPTIKELQTIVDEHRADPAIDLSLFPHTPGQVFWTSSTAADTDSGAWYVDFFSGYTFAYERVNAFHVRCVR